MKDYKHTIGNILKKTGIGNSAGYRMILEYAYENKHRHFSMKELPKRTHRSQMDKLVDFGLLTQSFYVGKNKRHISTVYQTTLGTKSHSHLMCNECGSITEYDNELAKELTKKIAEYFKFEVDYMEHHISGRCKKCTGK